MQPMLDFASNIKCKIHHYQQFLDAFFCCALLYKGKYIISFIRKHVFNLKTHKKLHSTNSLIFQYVKKIDGKRSKRIMLKMKKIQN